MLRYFEVLVTSKNGVTYLYPVLAESGDQATNLVKRYHNSQYKRMPECTANGARVTVNRSLKAQVLPDVYLFNHRK